MLLRVEEAANFLGLKPTTLAIWRMRGEGPAITRLGTRSVRYAQEDLEKYVNDRRDSLKGNNGNGDHAHE